MAPLIEVLDDAVPDVRTAAMYALGEIGDTRAVQPLAGKLVSEGREIRVSAASALGQIGDTAAVEPLIQALDETIPEPVREPVAEPMMLIARSFDINKPGCNWREWQKSSRDGSGIVCRTSGSSTVTSRGSAILPLPSGSIPWDA